MELSSEGKQEFNKIRVQKGVVKVGDRFLILLRSKDEKAFPGLWDFPGGKLEAGEDLVDSLKREVSEETGLAIETTSSPKVYLGDLNGTQVEFLIYDVNVTDGDPENPVIGNEHSDFRLETSEGIRKLNTMPYMSSYLENHSDKK